MQCIEGDDGVLSDTELGKQRLSCRDFIGFRIDIKVREHEFCVGGERAEDMSGGLIVELIETAAQGLAVQCDTAGTGLGVRPMQHVWTAREVQVGLCKI